MQDLTAKREKFEAADCEMSAAWRMMRKKRKTFPKLARQLANHVGAEIAARHAGPSAFSSPATDIAAVITAASVQRN